MSGKEITLALMMLLMLLETGMSVSVSVAAATSAVSSSRRRGGSEVKITTTTTKRQNRGLDFEGGGGEEMEGEGEGGEDKDELQLENHYYTMYSYQSRANLKIKQDGRIEWDHGSPNLYSLFFERLVNHPNSKEQMYVLEATASAYLICMNKRGRFYTISMAPPPPMPQPQPPSQLQSSPGTRSRKDLHIRHKEKKRWRSGKRRMTTFPPTDCLFKTYEFTADESFEKAVGIYSYPHSNQTHGRFLSRNPRTGKVRSYRKAFSSLYRHSQTKITQLPVRYLRDMIVKTRFSREDKFNLQVRQCILHLLSCPEQKEKMREAANITIPFSMNNTGGGHGGGGFGRRAHLHRIIERCKRRAQQTDKLPKCKKPSRTSSSKFKRKLEKKKI